MKADNLVLTNNISLPTPNNNCELGNETVIHSHVNSITYASVLLTWAVIPVDLIGLIGSIMIIIVRFHPSLRSPINVLLIGLGFADAGVLLFGFLAFVPQNLYDYYSLVDPDWQKMKAWVNYSLRYFYSWAMISQTASIYILVLVTIERYLAICRPLLARRLCTVRVGVVSLGLLFGFCILYNSPTFFENQIQRVNGSVRLVYNYDYWYRVVYELWVYLFVMFVLPFGLLSALNYRIVRSLRQSVEFRNGDARNENSTTRMLIMITTVFLLTNSCVFAARIYVTFPYLKIMSLSRQLGTETSCELRRTLFRELNRRKASFRRDICSLMVSLVKAMVSVNSAVNFPIYYKFSVLFRNGFRDIWFPVPKAPQTLEFVRVQSRVQSPLLGKPHHCDTPVTL